MSQKGDNKNTKKKDKIQEANEPTEAKKTSKKVIILSTLFILFIFIGTFAYMMNTDDVNNLGEILRTADYKWALFGLICLIVMWLAETVNMHIPLKRLYPTQKFTNSIKITMIGQLFNNLTPFSTGGQVMQVYEMGKSGKRTSDSLSILSMKFLVQQIMMMLFTVIVLIFQFNHFQYLFNQYLVIGIIGVSINVIL